MYKVSSMDLYNSLVLSFQNNHLKTHSNCSLLPNRILKLIQDGLLYYIQTSNCLAFFQNNNFYYEMWYYIGERKNDLVEIVSNKPVQISMIYQIGSNRIEYERNFWFNNGFYKNKIARRMVKQLCLETELAEFPNGFMFLKSYHLPEITEHLYDSFNHITDQLPTQQELEQAIGDKRLFGFINSQGELIAFIHFFCNKKYLISLHEWVRPSDRSKGLGKLLVHSCLNLGLKQGVQRAYAWVNEGNIPSEKLHLSLGFNFDGKISEKLIFDPTK